MDDEQQEPAGGAGQTGTSPDSVAAPAPADPAVPAGPVALGSGADDSAAPAGDGDPPAGTVAVELSGHIEIDGVPRLPGDVVHVPPDLAASLRWSGYATRG